MLTINQVVERSGEKFHTIQYWRRLGLLPEPAGVQKRIIFFDEGILQRISWIRQKQSEGASLDEIRRMLDTQASQKPKAADLELLEIEERLKILAAERDSLTTRSEALEIDLADITSFEKKWANPDDCKEDMCRLLGLDPLLVGRPTVQRKIDDEALDDKILAFEIYALLPAEGAVFLGKFKVSIYEEPVLIHKESIKADAFGMVLYLLGTASAKRGFILNMQMLPLVLFEEMNFQEIVGAAQTHLKLIEMGFEFSKFLKEHK